MGLGNFVRPAKQWFAGLVVATATTTAALAQGEAPLPQPAPAPAEAVVIPPRAAADLVGDILIQPIYHASLMLGWNERTVLIDPAQGPDRLAGLAMPDVILITDIHPDHLDLASVTAAIGSNTAIVAPQAVYDALPEDLRLITTVLNNGDTLNSTGALPDLGFEIEAVPMYNIGNLVDFHPPGRGNGYILTFGDTRVYVAGDTDATAELLALTDIDIAFVPIRPPFTMDIEAAAAAVLTIVPGIVYPYHYGDRATNEFADIMAFAALVIAGNPAIDIRLRDWYPE